MGVFRPVGLLGAFCPGSEYVARGNNVNTYIINKLGSDVERQGRHSFNVLRDIIDFHMRSMG